MKRMLFLVLIIFFPILVFAQSQSGDQELSASYGRKSGTEILKWFDKEPPSRDYGKYNVKEATTGNIFLTYRYAFTPIFSLGITAGTESFSYNSYDNQNPDPGILIAHYKVNVTTVALETKVVYYNGKKIKLYGFGGIGARFYTQKATPEQPFEGINGHVSVNTQTTPFGLSYGKKLAGFAEIGLGYKGLINGGVSYRIDRKVHPAKENIDK